MLHTKSSAGCVCSGLISPTPLLGQGFQVMLSRWGQHYGLHVGVDQLPNKIFHCPKCLTQLSVLSTVNVIGPEESGIVQTVLTEASLVLQHLCRKHVLTVMSPFSGASMSLALRSSCSLRPLLCAVMAYNCLYRHHKYVVGINKHETQSQWRHINVNRESLFTI